MKFLGHFGDTPLRMESNLKTVEDEDSATKHVLDYYKKYSQNKDLPKYFSGTSISYLPEIKADLETPEVIVKTDINIVITSPEVPHKSQDLEEQLDTSRASSAMSNRKLEWDNGADIGYENIQDIKRLHKSVSLPALTELKQVQDDFQHVPAISNIEFVRSQSSSDDGNIKIVLLDYSTTSGEQSSDNNNIYSSCSSQQEQKYIKPLSSTSSSVNNNNLVKSTHAISSGSDSDRKLSISQFPNTLSYVKQKIGLPDAQSTPKVLEGRKSDPELFLNDVKDPKKHNLYVVRDTPSTSKSEELLSQGSLQCNDDNKLNKPALTDIAKLKELHSKEDNRSHKKVHMINYRNKKIVNLVVTKPVTVECTCTSTKISNNQALQASRITTCATIGVQTDEISEKELLQIIQTTEKDIKNQSLIYVEYSESGKSDGKANACGTQTSSDVAASNCDSFEYFKNASNFAPKEDVPSSNSTTECEKLNSKSDSKVVLAALPDATNHQFTQFQKANVQTNLLESAPYEEKYESNLVDEIHSVTIAQDQTSNLRRIQRAIDLRAVATEQNSSESSKECYLGNVVSTSHLDNIGDDIEKSINMLQKLLKSKKYDPVTKKRYVKKIIQKITESKYLEESSTSSDLFCPKKIKSKDVTAPKLISMDTSDEKLHKSSLQSNLPWYPVSNEQVKLSPRRKQLVLKTFAQDFLPQQNAFSQDEVSSPQEIIPVDARDIRKNRFALTNNEFSLNHSYQKQEEPKSNATELANQTSESTSLEKQYDSSTTSKSVGYQNWKDDKTLSERLLEGNSHSSQGHGDCLVRFAEKEREYQINWINNEISHLGKLKGLLEKPSVHIQLPKHSKMSQPLKKTTVYTVSEDKDQFSNNEAKSKRTYVINTLLGTPHADEVHFKLDGKQFTVQEQPSTSKGKTKKKTRKVSGDIEVFSSDTTTNIKVTTFCDSCKRSPCVCDTKSIDGEKTCCSQSHTQISKKCSSIDCICSGESPKNESICKKCNKYPCICSSSSSMESNKTSKTICLICHRTPCICGKICLTCGMQPCVCSENLKKKSLIIPKDEYTGTFIPAILPKMIFSDGNTQKCSTFAAKDQVERNQISKLTQVCPTCGKCPCICEKLKSGPSMISKSVVTETCQDRSLKRVFENCACSTQTDCNCGFVEKLVSHFNTADIPSSTLKIVPCENKNSQTEEDKICLCDMSVQTQIDTHSQNLQTAECGLCSLENKISQTEESTLRLDCQNIGIQTQTDIRHKVLQTSSYLDVKQTILSRSKSTQVLNIDEKTQTGIVRTISLEDVRKNKGVTFVDKALCTDPLTKRQDRCICSATQTSPRSQSGSSRPSSSSRSSKNDNRNAESVLKCYCKQSTEPNGQARAQSKMYKNKTESSESKSSERETYETTSSAFGSFSKGTSHSVTESSSSKSSTLLRCVCCKEKCAPKDMSILGSKNENFPLCCNCVGKRPILTSLCYVGPEQTTHKPVGYKAVRTDLLDEITKTIDELNELEFCSCIKPSRVKNSKYCAYCQFKLGNTTKTKNAIAYTLTLEDECPYKLRRKKKKKSSLEEIKVKVPCSYSKQTKDKENFHRKDHENEKPRCGYAGTVCANHNEKTNKLKAVTKKTNLTLQDYLKKNRPDFINSAENRRHVVFQSRGERKFNKEEIKLRFLEDNMPCSILKRSNRLFTEQEMKEITKRNYKKLPEVQEKMNSLREQKLRNADRFIVDVFARKIRHSVLKGKSSFPIDTNVVCLPNKCDC